MHKESDKKRDGFLQKSKSLGDMLPAPAILESYEEVRPGTVDDLINIIKKEQKHRQAQEVRVLQAQVYTTRFGQLLAFALAVIIIYAAISFATDSMFLMSFAVLVCGFGFLAGVHLLPKYLETKKQAAHKKKNAAFKRNKNHYNRPKNSSSQGGSFKSDGGGKGRAGGADRGSDKQASSRRRIQSKREN